MFLALVLITLGHSLVTSCPYYHGIFLSPRPAFSLSLCEPPSYCCLIMFTKQKPKHCPGCPGSPPQSPGYLQIILPTAIHLFLKGWTHYCLFHNLKYFLSPRIYQSLDYTDDNATVFHAYYLSAVANAEVKNSVALGHFLLPPACLQEG